jgi:hypothetical protein
MAGITRGNLESAISEAKRVCNSVPFSTNPSDYALIGIEHGTEGGGFDEVGASEGNLQLWTEYTPRSPTVMTGSATEVQQTQGVLSGTVNANATDTHYYFQYGITTSYGSNAPAPPGNDAGSGTVTVPASTTVTSLQPSTTYHYRLVASNEGGITSYGGDETFTTLADPGTSSWIVRSPSTDPNSWQWTFYRGSGGNLTMTYYNGSSWGSKVLGGIVASGTTPSVIRQLTTDPNGSIWVFYQSMDGQLHETYYTGSGWEHRV